MNIYREQQVHQIQYQERLVESLKSHRQGLVRKQLNRTEMPSLTTHILAMKAFVMRTVPYFAQRPSPA